MLRRHARRRSGQRDRAHQRAGFGVLLVRDPLRNHCAVSRGRCTAGCCRCSICRRWSPSQSCGTGELCVPERSVRRTLASPESAVSIMKWTRACSPSCRRARGHCRQPRPGAETTPGRVLVMPFENVSREGRIVWLGEASAVLLADDLNAFGAPPSRATSGGRRSTVSRCRRRPH